MWCLNICILNFLLIILVLISFDVTKAVRTTPVSTWVPGHKDDDRGRFGTFHLIATERSNTQSKFQVRRWLQRKQTRTNIKKRTTPKVNSFTLVKSFFLSLFNPSFQSKAKFQKSKMPKIMNR
jgi:hypothetical protein